MNNKIDVEFYHKKRIEKKFKNLHKEEHDYRFKGAVAEDKGKSKFSQKSGMLFFDKDTIARINK